MNFNVGGMPGGPESLPVPAQRQYLSTTSTDSQRGAVTSSTQLSQRQTFLVSTALPEGLIGLVREGLVPQQGTPLPEAIVQITQPLSRVALSEGVTLVRSVPMTSSSTNGGSVTIRSTPISIPARTAPFQQQQLGPGATSTLSRHSMSSSLLDEDIAGTDYITLTSTHPSSMVFPSSPLPLSAHTQDRPDSQGRATPKILPNQTYKQF